MKLLFFSQPTCAPCKMMKPMVSAVAEENNYNINFIDSQDDGAADMFAKYNVLSTPTMIVIDDEENEQRRSVGAMTKPSFIEFMEG